MKFPFRTESQIACCIERGGENVSGCCTGVVWFTVCVSVGAQSVDPDEIFAFGIVDTNTKLARPECGRVWQNWVCPTLCQLPLSERVEVGDVFICNATGAAGRMTLCLQSYSEC